MNYILRYKGGGPPDAAKLRSVLAKYTVEILDDSDLPRMMLIGDVADSRLSSIKSELSHWEFFPQREQRYRVPDTRLRIGH